jgi:hypothetical protein
MGGGAAAGEGRVKPRRALHLAQAALALLAVVGLVVASGERARDNALTSFRHYRADWEDAWRAPVEHRAVEALGQLLSHPDRDPELAEAALAVMRRSPSWFAMGPDICSQIKGWLDVRLAQPGVGGDELRPAYELLTLAESDDLDAYRQRIAALAGDRSAEAAGLAAAAQRLQDHAGSADGDRALEALTAAWTRLRAPAGGHPLNWLAKELPVVATAEQAASEAAVAHLRALLEPYLGKAAGSYGETLPDEAMLAWLDRQAAEVNRARPQQRERLRQVRMVVASFAPRYHFEPVVDIACATALRYHGVPGGGVAVGLLVAIALVAGLWFAILRLVRGPMPVDVNAETMENVEPIDLDTDAETRSRSSASITDVG